MRSMIIPVGMLGVLGFCVFLKSGEWHILAMFAGVVAMNIWLVFFIKRKDD
jgi:hypothetical protein